MPRSLQSRGSSRESNFHFTSVRIALEFPDAARSEARGSAECVFHKLHVDDLVIPDFAVDSERARDRPAQFRRGVCEPAEDGDILLLTENCLRGKRVDVPVASDIVES